MTEQAKRIEAVLFDRDDTLIVDVPYNGDPARVQPMPTALSALRRLRARHLPVGVVTNQSGIGRGLLTAQAVSRVNARVEALLGRFDLWRVCPHAPGDGCACRKPRPAMILSAAAELGVDPRHLAVIGDIGADMEAARAAGAIGVLVPTRRTLSEECAAAPLRARSLDEAVSLLLSSAGEVAA